MKKKVLYAATVTKKHICQFHIPYLKMLRDAGYTVDVCAGNDFDKNETFTLENCDHYYDVCFDRDPFSLNNLKAYRQVRRIISENDYEMIHCHTPVAAAITRLAARAVKKKCAVLYTTHGFHFFKGAPLSGNLFYIAEKYLARYTDGIITINEEDHRAAERMCRGTRCRAYYVHGTGVDTARIRNTPADRGEILRELGLPPDAFVLLSVSEMNRNKNLKTTLSAFRQISDPSVYYIICGEGEMLEEYKKLSAELGTEKNVLFLGYRYDIFRMVHAADVFLFPSLREGLGIAPLEAMSAGVPLVASDIRGVREYARNGENSILLAPDDVQGFADAVIKLRNDPQLRKRMSENALGSVAPFDIHASLKAVEDIYRQYIGFDTEKEKTEIKI